MKKATQMQAEVENSTEVKAHVVETEEVISEDVIKVRELQVAELAIKNSVLDLEYKLLNAKIQYAQAKNALDTLFTEVANKFPGKQLNSNTLKLEAKGPRRKGN